MLPIDRFLLVTDTNQNLEFMKLNPFAGKQSKDIDSWKKKYSSVWTPSKKYQYISYETSNWDLIWRQKMNEIEANYKYCHP